MVGRRPRAERFRIYGEDEFFAQRGPGDTLEPSEHTIEAGGSAGRLGVAVGLAFASLSIALILASALGVVAPTRHVRRKAALRTARAQPGPVQVTSPAAPTRRGYRARPRSKRSARTVRERAPRTIAAGTVDTEAGSRVAHAAPALLVRRSASSNEGRDVGIGASSVEVAVSGRQPQAASRGEFGFER